MFLEAVKRFGQRSVEKGCSNVECSNSTLD